jgi:hypothetical protein
VRNRLALPKHLAVSIHSALLLVAGLGIVGCATKREVVLPAPSALLAAQPDSAEGSDRGIEIVVQTNAWDGYPRDLDANVIPLKVTIENHGRHPLAIRYGNFPLIAAGDRRYPDIPPYEITGHNYEHLQPQWAYSNAEYVSVSLPTKEMLEKAISEGTVSRNGTTGGFLYFHKPAPLSQALSFRAIASAESNNCQEKGGRPTWTSLDRAAIGDGLSLPDNPPTPRRVLQRCCGRSHSHLLFQEYRLRGYPSISGSLVLIFIGARSLHESNLGPRTRFTLKGQHHATRSS